MKILNLGCGHSKIDGADNVDVDPELGDLHFDIRQRFPLEDGVYDEVCFFHTIEHVQKKYHRQILSEIWRVLKEDGELFIAYPEFSKIVKYWLDNSQGLREEFWEATIFGRQLTPSDHHVCAMDSPVFRQELQTMGFYCIEIHPESQTHSYNTIVKCKKGDLAITYEQVLYNEVIA